MWNKKYIFEEKKCRKNKQIKKKKERKKERKNGLINV